MERQPCTTCCRGSRCHQRMSHPRRSDSAKSHGRTSRPLTLSRCACAICVACVCVCRVCHMCCVCVCVCANEFLARQMELWDVVDKGEKPKAGLAPHIRSKVEFPLDASNIDVYRGAHVLLLLLDPRKVFTHLLFIHLPCRKRLFTGALGSGGRWTCGVGCVPGVSVGCSRPPSTTWWRL